MVATTILYFLAENQSPNQSNGARGPLAPAWQGLRMPVACVPLVMSLPRTVDSSVPRSVLRRWWRRAAGRVWRLTHLGVTAACQRRLVARLHTGAVAGLAMGKEIISWYGCLLSSLRQAYTPSYAKSWPKRTTRCSRLRTAMQGSRSLTWRSRRVSRWTSGISSSGDMGLA